jgi:hypothetical protein
LSAREAILQAVSDQLGLDLTPEVVAAIDAILARLWMHGFKIVPVE